MRVALALTHLLIQTGSHKGGFMPLNFSPHPKLVPDLCPEPFAFRRSICRLQIPGLAPGTSRFNGPSIPATNLVTFSKYSENSCESPSTHLFPLAAVFPDRLFAYSVSSLHRGEVRHNLVLTWNRQSQVCKLSDCKQRGQVMTFRWMQKAETFFLSYSTGITCYLNSHALLPHLHPARPGDRKKWQFQKQALVHRHTFHSPHMPSQATMKFNAMTQPHVLCIAVFWIFS